MNEDEVCPHWEDIQEPKVCDMCGFECDELYHFRGRYLCYQCYIGEISNPELQLEEKWEMQI